MSSKGWSLFPGLIGLAGWFRSQIKISDSLAPDASRLGWKGLISSVRTGPTWEVVVTMVASLDPLEMKWGERGGEGRTKFRA